MKQLVGSTLLIGYGNPGRLDDGLGPALARRVRELGISRLTVETCYQLAVEHAELASGFDAVIFADAAVGGPEPFDWKPLEPRTTIAFSTHHVSPETILGLAHGLFQSEVQGFALAIRGYEFDDFGECLSPRAQENLTAAVEHVESLLRVARCQAR
jgi:hydrogenase maturation protease